MTTSAEELPELPEPELFTGERLTFGANQAIGVSEQSDNQINSKYVAGETRIVTEQARYPLNTIAGMVDSDDYELTRMRVIHLTGVAQVSAAPGATGRTGTLEP